jgi:hypothetical protein
MKRFIPAVVLSLVCAAAPALAQPRSIPEGAAGGTIRHVQEMHVQINGSLERLAPGAQIRDVSNRLVLPAAIPAGAPVKYLRDNRGLVHRVWILTPAEAAQRVKR